MDWKFKKDLESVGGGDGFWYDITAGGYIRPGEMLEDKEQLQKLEEAIDLVKNFEEALEKNELLNEF